MLGRHHVDGVHGGVEALGHHDHAAVVERGAGDLLARALRDEALRGGEHAVGQLGVAGHEIAARQGVVLGLGHEVGRHHDGVGRGVGQHADLGGASHHVDAHVAGDVALGGRHVGVAWPHDLVDRRDGLGAVGHGCHGLGAAHGVDLVHARERRGGERVGVEAAVPLRRGHHDHAGHARDLGGDGVHQDGRGVLGASARHVDGGGGDGRHLDPEQSAVGAGGEPGLLALALVEVADLVARLRERGEKLLRHVLERAGERLVGHAEGIRAGAVEAQAARAHRRVSVGADVVHDLLGSLHDLGRQGPRAAVEVRLREPAAPLEHDLPHDAPPSLVTSARRRARSRILPSQR